MKREKLNFSQSQFLEFKVERILAFVFQELNDFFSLYNVSLFNDCFVWKILVVHGKPKVKRKKERKWERKIDLEAQTTETNYIRKCFDVEFFVNIMYWVKYQKYLSFGSFILIQQYNTSSVCNFTLLYIISKNLHCTSLPSFPTPPPIDNAHSNAVYFSSPFLLQMLWR